LESLGLVIAAFAFVEALPTSFLPPAFFAAFLVVTAVFGLVVLAAEGVVEVVFG